MAISLQNKMRVFTGASLAGPTNADNRPICRKDAIELERGPGLITSY